MVWLIYLVVFGGMLAGLWGVFAKAGKPGWAAIVPFYNIIVFLEIVGRPLWWFVVAIIPCVNIVFAVAAGLDVAKAFGKGTGYAVGLILLPFVFYPMLGFGPDSYLGPPMDKSF
jgi:hypothetical protein